MKLFRNSKQIFKVSSLHRGQSTTTAQLPALGSFFHPGQASHEELHKFSVTQPEEFWKFVAQSSVKWERNFTQVMDCDMKSGKFHWFKDGTLNASGKACKFFCKIFFLHAIYWVKLKSKFEMCFSRNLKSCKEIGPIWISRHFFQSIALIVTRTRTRTSQPWFGKKTNPGKKSESAIGKDHIWISRSEFS